jgi:hypothetical protein
VCKGTPKTLKLPRRVQVYNRSAELTAKPEPMDLFGNNALLVRWQNQQYKYGVQVTNLQ